jgi:hypothetical protein
MELNNKQRRKVRRRNYLARELRDRRFQHQVIRDKRSHLIDDIHEHEAEEDLFDYFGIGKAPKE